MGAWLAAGMSTRANPLSRRGLPSDVIMNAETKKRELRPVPDPERETLLSGPS